MIFIESANFIPESLLVKRVYLMAHWHKICHSVVKWLKAVKALTYHLVLKIYF